MSTEATKDVRKSCALYSGTCGPASDKARQPSGDICTVLGGVFSSARLDGCTLDFNMYTSDEYGLSSSTVVYYHHKRKRHACIIESDSEDD